MIRTFDASKNLVLFTKLVACCIRKLGEGLSAPSLCCSGSPAWRFQRRSRACRGQPRMCARRARRPRAPRARCARGPSCPRPRARPCSRARRAFARESRPSRWLLTTTREYTYRYKLMYSYGHFRLVLYYGFQFMSKIFMYKHGRRVCKAHLGTCLGEKNWGALFEAPRGTANVKYNVLNIGFNNFNNTKIKCLTK